MVNFEELLRVLLRLDEIFEICVDLKRFSGREFSARAKMDPETVRQPSPQPGLKPSPLPTNGSIDCRIYPQELIVNASAGLRVVRALGPGLGGGPPPPDLYVIKRGGPQAVPLRLVLNPPLVNVHLTQGP